MTVPTKAFTIRSSGRARQLITEVGVSQAFQPGPGVQAPAMSKFKGIWDTGATGSVITQAVVDACGLKQTGLTEVHHAQGVTMAEVYLVNIFLHVGIGFHTIRVTKGELPAGAALLIGMDIITQGDLSVTNKDGKTCFSFRIPSMEEIDFEKALSGKAVDSNADCPCGSGKKFRKCCQGKGARYTGK